MEREAEIVAQSGRLGAVTIATNMAGRGTDIILGGNSEFMARLKLREILMPRYDYFILLILSSNFNSSHYLDSKVYSLSQSCERSFCTVEEGTSLSEEVMEGLLLISYNLMTPKIFLVL